MKSRCKRQISNHAGLDPVAFSSHTKVKEKA